MEQKGKSRLGRYRAKVEEEMTDFAITMEERIKDGWTDEKRFETFKEYLCRAADQTLGRANGRVQGWEGQMKFKGMVGPRG